MTCIECRFRRHASEQSRAERRSGAIRALKTDPQTVQTHSRKGNVPIIPYENSPS
jgi:hypothetical protein